MNLYTTIMICSMFHSNSTVNAIVEMGSHEHPLMVTTVSAQTGQSISSKYDFQSAEDAAKYARQQMSAGNTVEVGMMQIPSRWLNTLSQQNVKLEDLFRPCKNVAVGSDLLNASEAYCATLTDTGSQRDTCALSFYKTGDAKRGADYAMGILSYSSSNRIGANPTTQKVNYNAYMQSKKYQLPAPVFSDKETPNSGDEDDDSAA